MKDNITLSDCPSQTSGLTITEPLGTVEWKGDWSTLWNQATVEKNWKRWPRNSRGAFIKKFTYLSRLAMTTNSVTFFYTTVVSCTKIFQLWRKCIASMPEHPWLGWLWLRLGQRNPFLLQHPKNTLLESFDCSLLKTFGHECTCGRAWEWKHGWR